MVDDGIKITVDIDLVQPEAGIKSVQSPSHPTSINIGTTAAYAHEPRRCEERRLASHSALLTCDRSGSMGDGNMTNLAAALQIFLKSLPLESQLQHM